MLVKYIIIIIILDISLIGQVLNHFLKVSVFSHESASIIISCNEATLYSICNILHS